MKRVAFIAAASLAACLLSCKAKQAVITESDTALSVSDTTKVVADINAHAAVTIDTTKTTATYEGGGVIEFVEGGGIVRIDTAGNVTLDGVRSIKGSRRGRIDQTNGYTQAEEADSSRVTLDNGVKVDRTDHLTKTEEKPKQGRWYDNILATVGALCCIAALMWLLFLYIKQKK